MAPFLRRPSSSRSPYIAKHARLVAAARPAAHHTQDPQCPGQQWGYCRRPAPGFHPKQPMPPHPPPTHTHTPPHTQGDCACPFQGVVRSEAAAPVLGRARARARARQVAHRFLQRAGRSFGGRSSALGTARPHDVAVATRPYSFVLFGRRHRRPKRAQACFVDITAAVSRQPRPG